MIKLLMSWLAKWLKWDETLDVLLPPNQPLDNTTSTSTPTPMPPVTNQEKLYREAKVCLGYPQKLDSSVPNLLACASSLSGVLRKAGYEGLPPKGISGTAALNEFLRDSPDFEEQYSYTRGRGLIIISPSGVPGAVIEHGHCGVTGDNGIMSNDSDTGLWREAWTFQKWEDYYHTYGGLPVLYYQWRG